MDNLPPASSRARARAKAAYPWQFQPGRSGNPSGQSHFYHECRKIAREASPEMMRALIQLAKTAEDERVKSVCIVAVLDRAGVKPIDFDPNEAANAATSMPLEERKVRLAALMQRAALLLGLQVGDATEPADSTSDESVPAPSD